jgi:hypothetical protein
LKELTQALQRQRVRLLFALADSGLGVAACEADARRGYKKKGMIFVIKE